MRHEPATDQKLRALVATIYEKAWLADEEGIGSLNLDDILKLCERALGTAVITRLNGELSRQYGDGG